jgi:hypothetical protein
MHTQHIPSNDGVSFLNVDNDEEGEPDAALTTDGQQQQNNYKGKHYDKAKVTCHRCGKKGHYAPECSEQERKTGEQMLMAGMENGELDENEYMSFQFHQNSEPNENGRVPKAWILLDDQSTVDFFHNKELLTNIRRGNGYMDIHCNAGVKHESSGRPPRIRRSLVQPKWNCEHSMSFKGKCTRVPSNI